MIPIPRITSPSSLLPLDKAKKILLESFPRPLDTHRIAVQDAAGHILAVPIVSRRTIPPTLLCGPDGIAVKSVGTIGASPDHTLEVNAIRVNTGMPMPDGFDAVIRIEDVIELGEQRYLIHKTVSPYENTISQGADISENDTVMGTGHVITPFDIGALLTYGISEVLVRSVKVGLIATGDEVIPIQKKPLPGQIVDTNSYMIASYLRQAGITPVFGQVVPDDPAAIADELIRLARTCDMVLIFGGSSAGSRDWTVDAIEQSGDLLFHGVGMAPGKPVSLAWVSGKPVFGMPGPAIGSLIVLYELIQPLLRSWSLPVPRDISIQGELTETIEGFPGFDLFLMMETSLYGGKTLISPVPRTFGHMSGVRADGILHVKDGSGPLHKGSEVSLRLIRPVAT